MTEQPCCDYGPAGHSRQEHHNASACFDLACPFDHPKGGAVPAPLRPRGQAMTDQTTLMVGEKPDGAA